PGTCRAAHSHVSLVLLPCGLPVPAREEAEQREHEDDDQDDPEDAHVRLRGWLPAETNASASMQRQTPPAEVRPGGVPRTRPGSASRTPPPPQPQPAASAPTRPRCSPRHPIARPRAAS